jgi:hypothetical protein
MNSRIESYYVIFTGNVNDITGVLYKTIKISIKKAYDYKNAVGYP